MSVLEDRANWALDVNPPTAARNLTTNGSNWLWAVFAIFLVSFLIHAALSFKPRHGERIFSHIFTIALLAGALAYFAHASGLGSYAIRTSSGDWLQYPSYQIFWPKYAYWAISFAAIVLALGLLSGLSWASILFGIGLAWLWVFSYFISAMTRTSYKWGFFAIGTFAWLGLAILTMTARKRATGLGVGGHYTALAGWTNFIWLMYPIAFGISDGGNIIGVTGAFIFFGILDLLLLPVIAAAFHTLAGRWDYSRLGLHFTRHGRVHGPVDHTGPGYADKVGHARGPATTHAPTAGGAVPAHSSAPGSSVPLGSSAV